MRTSPAADLPPGEVEVRVAWSSVNYKDALATIPTGKVARISPLIPGIDLAGTVVGSDDAAIAVGSAVIAHGYELGVARHGGFAEYARVPAAWIVPLPGRPDAARGDGRRDGRVHGRPVGRPAGGQRADPGRRTRSSSPGASGGVGRTALAILAERGYEVWAATGKVDAHGGADRPSVRSASSPATRSAPRAHDRSRASAGPAAVDCVGAATLPYILRTLRWGGAVAASGNTSGAPFSTTVFPFILRGVALLGIDSAQQPIVERRRLWDRIAEDLRPRGLGEAVTEVGPRRARGGPRRRSWPVEPRAAGSSASAAESPA